MRSFDNEQIKYAGKYLQLQRLKNCWIPGQVGDLKDWDPFEDSIRASLSLRLYSEAREHPGRGIHMPPS